MAYVAPAATTALRPVHDGPRDPAPPPPTAPCPRCRGTDWTRWISGSGGRWRCRACWAAGRDHTGGAARRSVL